jgi:putative transposase
VSPVNRNGTRRVRTSGGGSSTAGKPAVSAASDWYVIICRSKRAAQAAFQAVRHITARLKLTLHPTKTQIVGMGQAGFRGDQVYWWADSPPTDRTYMPTIAQLKQQVDRIWVASFQTDLADTLAAHLRRHALLAVQDALSRALMEELEAHRQRQCQSHLGVAFQRSGSYTRRVLTSHSFIPDLHVPKLRGGNANRPWQVLKRYQLAMPLLLDQALYLYTLGLSLRDLQEALYVLFGHVLSREAVNRVTIAAQSPMETWRTRALTDTPPILIVAGVWGHVLCPTAATWTDQSGHERREMRGVDQVILTVMGVWPDGRHQSIHYQLAAAEDTAGWSDLLAALIARGLDASAVQLVVSDGSTGLPAARSTSNNRL